MSQRDRILVLYRNRISSFVVSRRLKLLTGIVNLKLLTNTFAWNDCRQIHLQIIDFDRKRIFTLIPFFCFDSYFFGDESLFFFSRGKKIDKTHTKRTLILLKQTSNNLPKSQRSLVWSALKTPPSSVSASLPSKYQINIKWISFLALNRYYFHHKQKIIIFASQKNDYKAY